MAREYVRARAAAAAFFSSSLSSCRFRHHRQRRFEQVDVCVENGPTIKTIVCGGVRVCGDLCRCCKTVSNENSSCFALAATLGFNAHVVADSFKVEAALLETSRVACGGGALGDSEDFRNFHVLHQLAAGLEPGLREVLGTQAAQAYDFLGNREEDGRPVRVRRQPLRKWKLRGSDWVWSGHARQQDPAECAPRGAGGVGS